LAGERVSAIKDRSNIILDRQARDVNPRQIGADRRDTYGRVRFRDHSPCAAVIGQGDIRRKHIQADVDFHRRGFAR
jgi:hypothetical protein